MDTDLLFSKPVEACLSRNSMIYSSCDGVGKRQSLHNLRYTIPSMSFQDFCQTSNDSLADVLLMPSENYSPTYEKDSDKSELLQQTFLPQQEDSNFTKSAVQRNFSLQKSDPYQSSVSFPEAISTHVCFSTMGSDSNGFSESPSDKTSIFLTSFKDSSLRMNQKFSTCSDHCSSSKYTLRTGCLDPTSVLQSVASGTPLIPWVFRQNTDIASPSLESISLVSMALNSPCESLLPYCALTADYPVSMTSPNWESLSAPARVQSKLPPVNTFSYDKTPERAYSLKQDYIALTEPSYASNALTYDSTKAIGNCEAFDRILSEDVTPKPDKETIIHPIDSKNKAMSSTSTTRTSSLCLANYSSDTPQMKSQSSPNLQDSSLIWDYNTPFHLSEYIQSKKKQLQKRKHDKAPYEQNSENGFTVSRDVSKSCWTKPSPNPRREKQTLFHQTLVTENKKPEAKSNASSGYINKNSCSIKDDDAERFLPFLKTQNILLLARDQTGSRRLQSLLNQKNKEIIKYILSRTYFELSNLMTDLYGNYFCQVLFQACSSEQRILILQTLAPNICHIASDPRGTHAMQAFILLVKSHEEQALLINHLHPNFLFLSTHPFGTHVIQQTLTYFRPPVITIMFEHIIQNINSLAENPHGVCVVKRGISTLATFSSENDKSRELENSLCQKLSSLTMPLSQSPFGNYVVQHAIVTWGPERCISIFSLIQQNLIDLATQKFSSNVVEQMLIAIPQNEVIELLKLMSLPDNILRLMNSSYGNFVVKKAFERCPTSEYKKLIPQWFEEVSRIQNKRLQTKWEKTLHALNSHLCTSH